MLSSENTRILNWVRTNGKCFFSDDPRPSWITETRLDALVRENLLRLQVHPSGVSLYIITPAGEDAIEDRQWTRGLAIASIIISVGSLIVSLISLAK